MNKIRMHLDKYENAGFERGSSKLKELLWMAVQAWLFGSWLPGSGWRARLLRAFGAEIGHGVVIKPNVSIKFPWRLSVGDHTWIGEYVWIDNLDNVKIGSHTCISQGAYICTGSHNWSDPGFGLIIKPVEIGDGVWVGAKANLAPGTILEDGVVIAMGTFGSGRCTRDMIYFADGHTRQRSSIGSE